MSAAFTLYDYVLSGNCYKIRLFASLLAMPYQSIAIDFYPGYEHRSERMLALNPAGTLPVMVTAAGGARVHRNQRHARVDGFARSRRTDAVVSGCQIQTLGATGPAGAGLWRGLDRQHRVGAPACHARLAGRRRSRETGRAEASAGA